MFNVQVAQVVAHVLKISLDKVRVQPTNTVVSPNTAITGGSVGSELACSVRGFYLNCLLRMYLLYSSMI